MHEDPDVTQERGVRSATRATYAIIPEWIIDAEISHVAVRLYAVLARYANMTGESYPRRSLLAKRLRCSTDTVDRAANELAEAGAIEIQRRIRSDGGYAANLYILREAPASPAANEGYPPLRTDAASKNESQSTNERDQGPPSVSPPPGLAIIWPKDAPTTVARKKVTFAEAELASQILASFNLAAGSKFTPGAYLGMIIGRIREHPEVTFAGHLEIIQTVLNGKRWWEGRPRPNIIYGNAPLFEGHLDAAAAGPDPNRPLTSDDLRRMAREQENVIDAEYLEIEDGLGP